MNLYEKLLLRIENGKTVYCNVTFAKDLAKIADEHYTQQINKLNIADVSKSAFKIDKNKAISDITKDFCKHYNLSENIEKDLLKLNSYCWIDGVHSC